MKNIKTWIKELIYGKPAQGLPVSHISTGTHTTCGPTEKLTLYQWGYNIQQQLQQDKR